MTTLYSPRLTLEPINYLDLYPLVRLFSDIPVLLWLLDGMLLHHQPTVTAIVSALIEESFANFATRGVGLWALRLASGECVGVAGLRGLGEGRDPAGELQALAAVAPDQHRRRGYTAEAFRVLLAHGFGSVGLLRVLAHTNGQNEASRRVLARFGFVLDERAPLPNGMLRYALTREAFHRALRC